MEISKEEELAALFRALSDPTRLRIYQFLRCCAADGVEVGEGGECRPAGSLSVGEVCCRLDCSMSNVSHHLKELRTAGLIRTEKRGRWIFCSIHPEALERIGEWASGPVDQEAGCGSE
ncbi:MAG: helix-turn-helix transcriptional regulator [Armatimonadetes bacterium]|nr:helix-turn-helix transcriptional regulator [Armatimonadota bacterium]